MTQSKNHAESRSSHENAESRMQNSPYKTADQILDDLAQFSSEMDASHGQISYVTTNDQHRLTSHIAEMLDTGESCGLGNIQRIHRQRHRANKREYYKAKIQQQLKGL